MNDHATTVDPLAPPTAPPMRVAVFPDRQKQLRVAVCPVCWWGTVGEVSPQAAVLAAHAHERECPGSPPAGMPRGVLEERRRLYRKRVGTLA